jgi:hypothetical protein
MNTTVITTTLFTSKAYTVVVEEDPLDGIIAGASVGIAVGKG